MPLNPPHATPPACRRRRGVALVLGLTTAAGLSVVTTTPAGGAPPTPPVGAAATAQTGPQRTAVTPALDNGLARTPPMGFNDWNSFGCDVNEALIKQTADYFVSSGLKDAGYTYVNIDDCWLLKQRSADGHLVPDPAKFPDGIKGTADYVHARGLKLGIYEDAGTATCAGYPGSLGHEQTDASDFAAWGVDYLKYDNCNNQSDGSLANYQARYTAMGQALKKTGRPIVYSICEWGVNNPGAWAGAIGNLWRTTGDISDNWNSLKSIVAQNAPLAQYARPGAWNDPDMLEVGNGGMTDTEYRTHFGLWAVMAAPLLIGSDLRTATPATLRILLNRDVIAVDQDRLGVQGQVIADNAGTMVFSKPLTNGDRAIALYNSTDSARQISTTTAQAGITPTTAYRVKDLWSGATVETAGTISASVPAHGTALLRVSPQPHGWSLLAPHTVLAVTAAQADPSLPIATTPGVASTVTATVTDYGKAPVTDVRVTAVAPPGWTLLARGATSTSLLHTNKSLKTRWSITAPVGTAPGSYPVSVTTSYRWGGRRLASSSATLDVQVATPPPSGTSALSSIAWTSASNFWGPVEKDRSNGEQAAGDGGPITIGGKPYAKGLGVHAPSEILYYLGGRCSTLTSDVGLDDEVGAKGSVSFQVWADAAKVADSGIVTGNDAAKTVTADVHGATWLRLVVDDNGDTDHDHADWAGPQLTCAG